ncbi:MAG: xanthine dehydrogenase family protein subunit M [Firmicutes bacterium]|nr:xanthine dehydrogenase family protein subunit M [Bacillota bacterium]
MFPNPFDYYAPETCDDVYALLHEHGYDAKVIAGGQSLLPMMKLRLAAPEVLVDVNNVADLRTMAVSDTGLRLGALTRHAEMERAQWPDYPLLSATAGHIADPIVRNRGTMGGSLAHADPAADWGAALLALDARVTLADAARSREVRLDDFFVDTFTTVLEPTELLTAIVIPAPPRESRPFGQYLKLERKVGDFAVVGVAVTASLDDAGRVVTAGIGLASVGPRPLKAQAAEALLVGQTLSPAVIREAAEAASQAADPVSDRRGSAEYKRTMVRVFVERGLAKIQADWELVNRASA